MSEENSPFEFRDFVAKHIDSVGTLEVLLFFQAHSDTSWSAENLSRELRSNSSHVSQQLEKLAKSGLLKNIDKENYIFFAEDPRLNSFVKALAEMYATKRVSLITMIYETKNQDGIRLFADAFKIRKD